MPTARPSISARDGVIVLRSVNAVNATAPARPTPTPRSATSRGRSGRDEATEHDDEHDERDGQADDLAGADQRGVLGDLDAVVRGDAGIGEGGLAPLGDQRAVGDRHRLGVVVELHLDDGVPAVLAHEAGARRGAGHGLAVVVLRAPGGEVGLAALELGAALRELRAAGLELLAQPGSSVVGIRGDELVEQRLPPESWSSASPSFARPASSSR